MGSTLSDVPLTKGGLSVGWGLHSLMFLLQKGGYLYGGVYTVYHSSYKRGFTCRMEPTLSDALLAEGGLPVGWGLISLTLPLAEGGLSVGWSPHTALTSTLC